MRIAFVVVSALVVALADVLLIRKGQNLLKSIFNATAGAVVSGLASVYLIEFISSLIFGKPVAEVPAYNLEFALGQAGITLVIGFLWVFVNAILDGTLFCRKEIVQNKLIKAISIISVCFTFLGVFAFAGTNWSKEAFGAVDPDQLIVNILSPAEGTSDDVINTLLNGPILHLVTAVVLFSLFVFSARSLYIRRKDKDVCVFSVIARKIVALILSIAILAGGIAFGIKEFQLGTLYDMYYSESDFIEKNFADPREVKMQFPKQKRNLIHIYLESMENTYASEDLGGYMKENLIAPLTELAKEGISFSHLDKGLGGPISTKGCTWSVASMVNMATGLPMKVPTDGNDYGSPDNFLPGAVTLGDILKAQGYSCTLMFGASAKFGGLNFFYESHGDFDILDYNAAKQKGWISQFYKEGWGFEDDKLFEFARNELARLGNSGTPFYFVMETADTHAPDGYVSKNTPTPRDSQYANVVAYNAGEVVKFVRWIQTQPFYDNTTIVIIGDHLSMATEFFEDVDKSYLRTTFNLIINPARGLQNIPNERKFNRWWFNGDMFPTMLASIGVKIEGERLGLGTNLFSDKPTIMEENGEGIEGWKHVDEQFKYRSNLYVDKILSDNVPFDNKNVSVY
jgi:phosphoglycerol transferase